MPTDSDARYRCFVALPPSLDFLRIRRAVVKGVTAAGYQPVLADENSTLLGAPIREAIIGELAQADCIVADISTRSPNIYFELGLAQAMGKGALIIANRLAMENLQLDLRDFQTFVYQDTEGALLDLSNRIQAALTEYRRFPRRSLSLRSLSQSQRPFFIDWDRLERREIENLCRELLTQMGFQRLEWGKISPEIDLVAELPRKDPDGFEYRELWLIAMGLNAPVEMLLEMALAEPDYFLHRLSSYSETFDKSLARAAEAPITFLLILTSGPRESGELERIRERFDRRRIKRGSVSYSLRLRIWDQAYLTSLVHRFPQIGYKYFSDEGRIRSKTRKSYEELYREVAGLNDRQAKLITDLKEEKNKRVRAERDAVWKDISFSAAHKIGNPIFAIETDLDPLHKRIREQRILEAEEVLHNIRAAVEKAKNFVEQFKSLARAQEIKPTPTPLCPLLTDACRSVANTDITCVVDCPSDVAVNVDPDRVTECFDELTANAKHWFDKPEKKLEFSAIAPAPEPLPSFLDTASRYVLIHVKDNGPGIPVSNKEKIFDAFYTTYDHGTGLGLALVRRIIDGHGGGIVESGVPGEGADFEIYLPFAPKEEAKNKSSRRMIGKAKKR